MPYVKQITIRTTLNRSLKYIVNGDKTDYGCFVTGVNCATHDKLAYKQMLENKRNHNKEKGTLGFHFIQSFKENELNDPYKVHEIGLKWAEKMFGNKYQFIISTHLDKGHYHNHVIINSVSLEGKKFNACKQSLKDARDYSDEIAKEYSLNIIPFNKNSVAKSYKEWNEEKRGSSWKAHIKNDIDVVIKSAKTFEEFVQRMEQLGYSMKQGHVKHMTFKAPGMERSVRGKTLGPEYTEERIKERINLQATFKFTETKRDRYYRIKANRSQLNDAAWRYKFKHGSLAVNLILALTLVRTLAERRAIETKKRNTRRNFSADIEIAKLSNQLKFITDRNIKSRADLNKNVQELETQMNKINGVVKEANSLSTRIELVNQTIETYNKYKPIYKEYQAATFKKLVLRKKYGPELDTFDKALSQLNKMGVREEDFEIYAERQKSYEVKISQLKDRIASLKKEINQIREIEKIFDRQNHVLLGNRERKKMQER